MTTLGVMAEPSGKDFRKLVEEDEIINAHDVVSLITNVPIPQVLELISQRLRLDNSLHKCTKLLTDDVMELLEFYWT